MLFEMLYQDDVPERVAINEAVETAKQLGSDDSPRFVNGIADRMRKLIKEKTNIVPSNSQGQDHSDA